MQEVAFADKLVDIPWNFLVGGDGFVYEGRGYKYQGELLPKNSTSSYDSVGLIVAFIGTFTDQYPTPDQIETFKFFLENSVSRDLLLENYVLIIEDQLNTKENPAVELLESLKEKFDEFHPRMNS